MLRPAEDDNRMCTLCADRSTPADRVRILQLLALLEAPDALPAALAIRLAREICALALTSSLACDALGAPEAARA